MSKTWADTVTDVLNAIGEAAEEGDQLDKIMANAAFEITIKEMNTKSLARIATALYKIAGLEDKIEENENEEPASEPLNVDDELEVVEASNAAEQAL